jgi:hypothetical protein
LKIDNFIPGIKDPYLKDMFSIIGGKLIYPSFFFGNVLPVFAVTI